MPIAAEEWWPTEGLERNAQPKGGFVSLVDDAARQLGIRRSAPAERVAWNDRGVTVDPARVARRSRPTGP